MKFIVALFLPLAILFGSQIEVSNNLSNIKIKDQFENDMRVTNDISRIK